MRKANQHTEKINELIIEGVTTLKDAVLFLDVNAKRKAEKTLQLKNTTEKIRNYKSSITVASRNIKSEESLRKEYERQLSELPDAGIDEEGVRSQLESIAELPWVSKVHLSGSTLFIDIPQGALKTVFYNRYVYGGGAYVEELLPAPTLLDMPAYRLFLNLGNLGNGWNRSRNLRLCLAEPGVLVSMPNPKGFGLTQASYAHWATHESPYTGAGGETMYGELCLNQYDEVLRNAGSNGLLDLLNEVAIYLQNSGWANAYRTKMTWAVTLGFAPYTDYLTRPLLSGESFKVIQEEMRHRLPLFLKENGLTPHMYQYGTESDGSATQNTTDRMWLENMVDNFRLELNPGNSDRTFSWTGSIRPNLIVTDEIDGTESPVVPF